MPKYFIRRAGVEDISFLTEAIIAAEKSGSDKLGLSAIFNLTENDLRALIPRMLEEEIEGCEFSISSFLLMIHNGKPVATVGGWVEGHSENMKSAIIKSNLIVYYFPKTSISYAHTLASIISDIQIERELGNLQIEYVYTHTDFRGKGLGEQLIKQHLTEALLEFPELKKSQVQVFSNNASAIKLYEKCGFKVTAKFKSFNEKILEYMPHKEKLLMEKMV